MHSVQVSDTVLCTFLITIALNNHALHNENENTTSLILT